MGNYIESRKGRQQWSYEIAEGQKTPVQKLQDIKSNALEATTTDAMYMRLCKAGLVEFDKVTHRDAQRLQEKLFEARSHANKGDMAAAKAILETL